jgi:hypothetical protein
MFQMTDAALAEARRFCIRDHIVTENGCRFSWLYTRVVPSHAIQLAAVYLDRNVARILAFHSKPNSEHKQELASTIHLCGVGAANALAQRGFRLILGERCGEHDITTYLARVQAMEREFLRLATNPEPTRLGALQRQPWRRTPKSVAPIESADRRRGTGLIFDSKVIE